MLYSHHSQGIGHLIRTIAIAEGIVAVNDDVRVLIVSGGEPVEVRTTESIEIIDLPPFDENIAQENLSRQADEKNIMSRRKEVLGKYLESFKPDFLITEFFPFGRFELSDEIFHLLVTAQKMSLPPRVISSVRDMSWIEGGFPEKKLTKILNSLYDYVCVHSDERWVNLSEQYALPGLQIPVIHTGYVCRQSKGYPNSIKGKGNRKRIVVNFGGGRYAAEHVKMCVDAFTRIRQDVPSEMYIFLGPFFDGQERKRLQEKNIESLYLKQFEDCFPDILQESDLLISHAGYNISAEIMKTGVNAIILPLDKARDVGGEQANRAEILRKGCSSTVCSPTEISGDMLTTKMYEKLNSSQPSCQVHVDGARWMGEFIASFDNPRPISFMISHEHQAETNGYFLKDLMKKKKIPFDIDISLTKGEERAQSYGCDFIDIKTITSHSRELQSNDELTFNVLLKTLLRTKSTSGVLIRVDDHVPSSEQLDMMERFIDILVNMGMVFKRFEEIRKWKQNEGGVCYIRKERFSQHETRPPDELKTELIYFSGDETEGACTTWVRMFEPLGHPERSNVRQRKKARASIPRWFTSYLKERKMRIVHALGLEEGVIASMIEKGDRYLRVISLSEEEIAHSTGERLRAVADRSDALTVDTARGKDILTSHGITPAKTFLIEETDRMEKSQTYTYSAPETGKDEYGRDSVALRAANKYRAYMRLYKHLLSAPDTGELDIDADGVFLIQSTITRCKEKGITDFRLRIPPRKKLENPSRLRERLSMQSLTWLEGAYGIRVDRDSARHLSIAIDTVIAGPKEIHIEVINRCPLDCIYCWFYSPLRRSPVSKRWGSQAIGIKKFKDIIADAAEMGTERVNLTGCGEPLMHPDILEMAQFIIDRGMSVQLPTCGVYLSDEMIDTLLKGKHNRMYFNISAANERTADQIRTDGSRLFRELKERINTVVRKREGSSAIIMIFKFILMKRNIDDIVDFVRFAHENRADYVEFQLMKCTADTHCITMGLEEARASYRLLKRAQSLACRLGLQTNLERTIRILQNLVESVGSMDIQDISDPLLSPQRCLDGWFNARVTLDGKVGFCCDYGDFFGDISEKSFKDVWFSDEAMKERMKWRYARTEKPSPECAVCDHFDDSENACRILGMRGYL